MKTVQQLLSHKGSTVLSISPEASVHEALVLMAKHHIGALVVTKNESLVGIFSERDYARSVTLEKPASAMQVADIMSPKVITVGPEDTVETCMNLMSGKRIRHLPVVKDNAVIGMLSIGDLVKETIAYQAMLIQQLEQYIQS